MRTALLLPVMLAFSLYSLGCESTGTDSNYEWKSYQDTFNIFLESDSVKFLFISKEIVHVLTIPSISYDTTLSDSVRFEIEVQKEIREGKNIVSGPVSQTWMSDTLIIDLDYYPNAIVPAGKSNKTSSQLPQRTPKYPVLRITSAKLFIPPHASAMYIGF